MEKAKKKLQVKNLQISFRTQRGILKAVRDINFDLMEGETLAIVGESGSGKSVTSKAIIGILSGNSIVEGGEILYDGKDLLKIPEEDMHKIRGDKIAMIFQDPLSALNPIMRIGKQLTEAMILNGKARQKNSHAEYVSHLKALRHCIASLEGEDAKKAELCDVFNRFVVDQARLEKNYSDAYNAAVALTANTESLLFFLEKDQTKEYGRGIAEIKAEANKAIYPYVIPNGDEVKTLLKSLSLGLKNKDKDAMVAPTTRLNELAKEGTVHPKPDFFRLGYYHLNHPDLDPLAIEDIPAFDEKALAYLDENFMKDFLLVVEKALAKSREDSLNGIRKLLPHLKELRDEVSHSEGLTNKSHIYKRVNDIAAEVKAAIDPLRIVRASSESSFKISIIHELDRYYYGLKINPKNQAKYERAKKKWDSLSAAGKTPSWQVIPPYLVDLELTKSNVEKILDNLITHYERSLSKTTFVPSKQAVALVDYLKEQTSRFVTRVTQGTAKARALELMKEVGIPQPHIRFRQYPFEFSGGMRQRIVIAIALSANPDILICDEPTTALDVTIQAQILELINKIKAERHLSVIFITHDLGVVANMADRIAVMYAGKIIEVGTADDIFYDPRHPYTWALLSSMPDLDTNEKLEAIPGTPPNMIYPPVGDAFAERNKYAVAIDFEKQPPMFEISETHSAATWLLHPQAPKVQPPKIITDRIARMKKEAKNYHGE